ncbi:DDE-type integrase/transposase/recombinase [Burkholderia plantarii]|uniref:DDE-type integrase/transposase/recombinase n=2 Tax=Burkholderia plantarii TaxID=41899 RepID=UPI003132DFB4
MGWHVRKRPVGFRPRVQSMPSVALQPNERWSTDMCRVWAGRDGWATLALVIDCYTRELLGWHLSRSGKATTATDALEHALIARFGTLGRVSRPFLLRNDNGPVFTSQKYTKLVRNYAPATASIAADEGSGRGICFSRLTCAGLARSLDGRRGACKRGGGPIACSESGCV